MKLNMYLSFVLGLFSTIAGAQEISIDQHKEEVQSSMMGFIDAMNSKLSSELDSIRDNGSPGLEIGSDDLVMLKRLKSIVRTIPLEYNAQVKSYIEKYISQNYRPYMNRLMGLSQHYFSIYEPIFKENGIPEEVKYLSLVESSLNPHLISTSGAVGPWQFMYATAKIYNLDMNSAIDERKDAYASSYAVAKYLNEAYDQFNDWLLALASYNCGRGCVQRAIQRSGLSSPSFWELSPYLPSETRNYIPKYIAMTYAMELASYYDIYPEETELSAKSKVFMLDRAVDLRNVANAIQMPLDQLKRYNPSYKHTTVHGTVEHPKRLLLPLTDGLNDSLLYVALHSAEPLPAVKEAETESLLAGDSYSKTYRVKHGESLYDVSKKFGVSVQNLRAWNKLRSKSNIVGRTLTVSQKVDSRLVETVNRVSAKKNVSSSRVVYYTVKSGDSLDRIVRKYEGLSVAKLKADNGLKSNVIQPGMRLKINRG